MATARAKLPEALEGLLRSQMDTAIQEANLGTDDTDIAIRYLIDQSTQMDIAAAYGWDRSTIAHRLKRITAKVEQTAKKLGFT